MKKSDSIQIKQSEARQKINDLLTLETMTDEQRNELEVVTKTGSGTGG